MFSYSTITHKEKFSNKLQLTLNACELQTKQISILPTHASNNDQNSYFRYSCRFHVKTSPENEDLYNDDDKNLIMSIEKEYLTNEDNILPGQIID